MNVAILEEKWGRYCNINNLVNKVCDLYKANGHSYTTHGICKILDEYFTQKAPLIDMFMTSNHYIGDMRIAIKKEFERQISSDEIRTFFCGLSERLSCDNMLQRVDDSGKTMYDYLKIGKKQITIQQLASIGDQQAKVASIDKFRLEDGATSVSVDKLRSFEEYMSKFRNIVYGQLKNDIYSIKGGPAFKAGMKTSRAFNAVCRHYGVDKFNPTPVTTTDENGNVTTRTTYPYDKVFATYADLVSDLARKMYFIISLNPLDYLTMSNGISWKSCHNIYNGCNKGGVLSYMLDSTSIITFVVSKLEDEIHDMPKYYRQMFHYKDNLFMQNRLYPQGNDGATNLYDKFRGLVIEEFSELIDAEDVWKVNVGTEKCKEHVVSFGTHYKDYLYNESCNIFYPHNSNKSVKDIVLEIGHNGICAKCGKTYTSCGNLTHGRYDSECRI